MSASSIPLILAFLLSRSQALNRFANELSIYDSNWNNKLSRNHPYTISYPVTYEYPQVDNSQARFAYAAPSQQMHFAVSPRQKASTRNPIKNPTKELLNIVEEIFYLLVDRRLCEIDNSRATDLTKRSLITSENYFQPRAASTTEPSTFFNPQQLSFLKDMKLEDVLASWAASAVNRTLKLPPPQILPNANLINSNIPTVISNPAALHTPMLAPITYVQSHYDILPVHPVLQQPIYYPSDEAVAAQIRIYNPYVEPPVAPQPASSPFLYSLRILAPVNGNPAMANTMMFGDSLNPAAPTPSLNNYEAIKPNVQADSIITNLVASKLFAKPESPVISNKGEVNTRFPESKILQSPLVTEQVTNTGQNQTKESAIGLPSGTTESVVRASARPDEKSNPTKDNSDVVKNVKIQGKVASEIIDSVELKPTQPMSSEQMLQIFKTIREELRNNRECKPIIGPYRRAVGTNERPMVDLTRNPHLGLFSRYAVPSYNLNRHRNQPSRIWYHKAAPLY